MKYRRKRVYLARNGAVGFTGDGARASKGDDGFTRVTDGTGGQRRGLAGHRDDAPGEARGADGSRAGRRAPTHTAAGPSGPRNTSGTTHPPGYAKGAGTAVPAPLSAHSATASSRLRPNDPQSWRRRRIHRNMPPTTAAPRPAPPIRPSKPVRARPFFGLVAGASGAT